METVQRFVWSWDATYAFVLSFVSWLIYRAILGAQISAHLLRDLFFSSVTLGAIVFAIYFAAIALLVSSGNKAFFDRAIQKGTFHRMMKTYRQTLIALIFLLVVSISTYGVLSVIVAVLPDAMLNSALLILLIFVTFYPLFAATNTGLEALAISESSTAK